MIANTNSLIDNPHNLYTVNRVDVEYGKLKLIFNRKGDYTEVTITSDGYPITVNEKGEVSHYLTLQAKKDLERLLRNYTIKQNSEYVFNDYKFFNKFEKNIVATF